LRRRNWPVATLVASILILVFSVEQCAHGAEVEPFVEYSHTSDIFRGCPLHCEQSEPLLDYAGVGVTITAGRRNRWEIDISHGYKRIDSKSTEPGSKLAIRFYPRRNRNDSSR
jgi:hypothetical protein